MRVLLSWVREMTPVELGAHELADVLTGLGLAVEDMRPVPAPPPSVVVARVVALRPHPDADRVQLVDVDAGEGRTRQVVCGAFNMAVGDLVPLALPGTRLPGGLEIGERKVRGQISEGMLCAPDEIGFGTDHSGILILPVDGAAVGTPLAEALGISDDVVFDLEVNANRPDAMSVLGVARDLSAKLGTPLTPPDPRPEVAATADPVSVEIVDLDRCGRFCARVFTDVTVGPSHPVLARRLSLMGMRPVNNLVDASNAVMLELGQPNHPYDLARLGGRGLRIRLARPGERLRTLDGVDRELGPEDLLICDAEDTPVGLAGIIGGEETEITPATTEVLLEVAWFDPMTIARTARRLGVRTEASARFERGTDPEVIDLAVRRFASWCGPAARMTDTGVDARGRLPEPPVITLRTERVPRLLGAPLEPDTVARHLTALGFRVEPAGAGRMEVHVPTWRPDVTGEVDLIEEVARLEGYDALGRTVARSPLTGGLDDYQRFRRDLRDVLCGLGYHEVMPSPFLAPGDLERAGLEGEAVHIANPLVAEESVLRTDLLPGMLKIVAYNASHRLRCAGLWEIGRVFLPPDDGNHLPTEVEMCGLVCWDGVADAKIAADVIADAFGVAVELRASTVAGLHPGRSATLTAGGTPIGVVGEVDPVVCERFGVSTRLGWLALDVRALFDAPRRPRRPVVLSRHPSSDVDLSFEVPEEVPAAEVESTIAETAGPLCVSVALFDVFRGEGVSPGHRSLTFRLRFQAPDRTLTDAEVAEVRRRVIAAVERRHGARLRGAGT